MLASVSSCLAVYHRVSIVLVGLPALRADQRHEAHRAERLLTETVAAARDADQLLLIDPAQRHYQPAAVGQLSEQRVRDAGSRGGHGDRIEGRILLPATGPVAQFDPDIGIAKRVKDRDRASGE